MRGTVLFVDDEMPILAALSRIFADDETIEIVTALDGQEALDIIQKGRIDLVISDQMLPGMDGITLLRSVRALYPSIDVMMLTGHAEDKVTEIAEALGVGTVILNKPWDIGALRKAVEESLDRRREA